MKIDGRGQTCNSVSPYPVESDIPTLPFLSSVLNSSQSPFRHAEYAGFVIWNILRNVKFQVIFTFGAWMMPKTVKVNRLENHCWSLKVEDRQIPFLHGTVLYIGFPFSDQRITTAGPTRRSADHFRGLTIAQCWTLSPTASTLCDKYALSAAGRSVSPSDTTHLVPKICCLLVWASTPCDGKKWLFESL